MAFRGFPKEGISWFQSLALTQTREWFHENRAAYDTLWVEPMTALLDELRAPLQKVFGRALGDAKVFRIHRDVRFAKDKTPYKTHVAGMLRFEGYAAMEGPAPLYLQLGLQEFVGFGFYFLETAQLKRLRAAALHEKHGPALQKALATARKSGLDVDSIEQLKRVPPGVPAEHPLADVLRHKGLAMGRDDIPKKVRFSKDLAPWLVEQAKAAAPVVAWGFAQKLG